MVELESIVAGVTLTADAFLTGEDRVAKLEELQVLYIKKRISGHSNIVI